MHRDEGVGLRCADPTYGTAPRKQAGVLVQDDMNDKQTGCKPSCHPDKKGTK